AKITASGASWIRAPPPMSTKAAVLYSAEGSCPWETCSKAERPTTPATPMTINKATVRILTALAVYTRAFLALGCLLRSKSRVLAIHHTPSTRYTPCSTPNVHKIRCTPNSPLHKRPDPASTSRCWGVAHNHLNNLRFE